MRLSLNIFGKEFGVVVGESPAPAPRVDLTEINQKVEHIARELNERERWETWQRQRGASGGQFGFAANSRPIQKSHTRWEPR
ncbi:hypothetical protein [Rhodococcus phage REQ1]|uniref:hypothetical protein n=1 Tax=Rhodococcus phage REQ1 TaxID=1109712 RepID=UPI00023EEC53|nr:hypothetical protein RoPhREQ1_gp49 [Rhodococcus phage REQ1]AEV52045.1 hypothetical protein [Rhodococcus phage REQ1]